MVKPWNKALGWNSDIVNILSETNGKKVNAWFDKMLGFHMQFCGFEIVLGINREWYINDTFGG